MDDTWMKASVWQDPVNTLREIRLSPTAGWKVFGWRTWKKDKKGIAFRLDSDWTVDQTTVLNFASAHGRCSCSHGFVLLCFVAGHSFREDILIIRMLSLRRNKHILKQVLLEAFVRQKQRWSSGMWVELSPCMEPSDSDILWFTLNMFLIFAERLNDHLTNIDNETGYFRPFFHSWNARRMLFHRSMIKHDQLGNFEDSHSRDHHTCVHLE